MEIFLFFNENIYFPLKKDMILKIKFKNHIFM